VFNNIALAKKQSSVSVNDAVILREHEGVLVVIRLAALRDDGKRLSVSPREKLLTSFHPQIPTCPKVYRLLDPKRLTSRCVVIFHRRPSAICERQTSLISTLRLEEENMLGFLALVLIVLWLLGFLAFHVSSGLIHVLLVVGVIMLVFHFLRGSPRTV
jgi:hypothetical protein